MDSPIPIDLGRIAQDLQIRRVQVEAVVQLLDEDNTVPFITRYRKERTGNLGEVLIREIQGRVTRLRELVERKETILKSIETQGKLTDDLAAAIRAADNPKRLEDLYLPYKPKKKTKASEARDKGLEPLALRVWNGEDDLTDLQAAAVELLNPEKGLETTDQVLTGVGHILAEYIGENAVVRDLARRALWRTGRVLTTKAEDLPEGQGLEYRDYFAYSEPIAQVPPHRVLAINRGDKEGPLKVKMESDRAELEKAVFGPLGLEGRPHGEFLQQAAVDALDRLLLPSLEREVRRDLTEMAERHAVEVFARNLRSLLLQPPILKQVVLAIDPGFRTGCKVAVIDPHGQLLEHTIIYPHQPQSRRYEAKQAIKDLVAKHQVNVVAIGNGTACRETEELVAEVITEGTYFHENPEATSLPGYVPPAPAETTIEATTAEAPEPSGDGNQVHTAETSEQAPSPEAVEAPTTEPESEAPVNNGDGNPTAEGPSPEPEALPPVSGGSHAPGARWMNEFDRLPPIRGGAPESGEGSEQGPGPEPPASEVPSPPTPETNETESSGQASPEPPAEGAPVAEATTTEPAIEPEVAVESPTEAASSVEEAPPVVTAEAAGPTEPGSTSEAAPTAEAAPKPARELKQPKHHREPRPPKPPKPKLPPPPPAPHASDAQVAKLAYVIVNEAGASVYSTSPIGREEFNDLDPTTRGTVSIGRRLQDPLSELVKIEPQNIGVGLYQHDVNPKQLKESLEGVIESCVNFVGVDLNTASVPLLRHVSGLNQLTARRIVDRRKEKGPFTSREQILEVEGIGPATYTQSAGFLKIPEAANPLDRTWVHPESYEAATKALEKLGFTPDVINHKDQMPALHDQMNAVDLQALATELGIGIPTLDDIFQALARPDRDPREDLPKPIFKRGVLKLEDLSAGMELKGTVLNVVDFGAFVDIGLKDSGLVHISQLANRYIKSPHDVVSVGDVVSVWVMGVDQERKRVSLTMVKPGSERSRTGGGPRREPGRPQGDRGQQGGDRGPQQGQGQRPPRRDRGPGPQGQGPRQGQGQQGPRPQPSADAPPTPATPPPPAQRLRIPGPPQRAQQQGRGYGGRPGGGRPGGGRPMPPKPAPDASKTEATPHPKPKKPVAPPPLSKDALKGAEPLRTFGQLKQLWQARETGEEPQEGAPPPTEQAAPPSEPPPAPEPSPTPTEGESGA